MQEDWDEEKEPDEFSLAGSVPEKEKPAANGSTAGNAPELPTGRKSSKLSGKVDVL